MSDRFLDRFMADVTARIVTAREALEDGAADYAADVLRELEDDLVAWTAWRERRAA